MNLGKVNSWPSTMVFFICFSALVRLGGVRRHGQRPALEALLASSRQRAGLVVLWSGGGAFGFWCGRCSAFVNPGDVEVFQGAQVGAGLERGSDKCRA